MSAVVECSIDETLQGDPDQEPEPRASLREEIADLDRIVACAKAGPALQALRGTASLLWYAQENPTRGRRRTPMNVAKMVRLWLPVLKALSTAHDKNALDEAECRVEELIQPVLAAPVKQIRRFYKEIVCELKKDPEVPFFVWSMFEAWGKVIIDRAPDGELLELKDDLASEIAHLVEKDVQPDITKAIAGALRWRSKETLEKVRDVVEAGEKPRLTGKQSCLFLEVGGQTVML